MRNTLARTRHPEAARWVKGRRALGPIDQNTPVLDFDRIGHDAHFRQPFPRLQGAGLRSDASGRTVSPEDALAAVNGWPGSTGLGLRMILWTAIRFVSANGWLLLLYLKGETAPARNRGSRVVYTTFERNVAFGITITGSGADWDKMKRVDGWRLQPMTLR